MSRASAPKSQGTSAPQVFTKGQNVHQFTNNVRMFNEKEANTVKNCVGGGCPCTQTVSQTVENFTDYSQGKQTTTDSPLTTPRPLVQILPLTPPIEEPNNATDKDFTYNSFEDFRAPTYNQWTRIYDDGCNEENRLRIGTKPMKYFVNQYNSPQASPFTEFTLVGNQKAYNVRNDFERALPTRLNPLYPVEIDPYSTTPNLGSTSISRVYVDTDSHLRWGENQHNKNSETAINEIDYNRWDPGVSGVTVQNAGQYAMKIQPSPTLPVTNAATTETFVSGPENAITSNNSSGGGGYYNSNDRNHVLLYNSAMPYFGLSSRNLLQNFVEISKC